MTYVMSDLHGQYEKFRKMLETISFTDRDELYILGDVVDRGPQPVELLMDLSMRINVFPVMGNHDMAAAILLRKLCAEITEENCETQFSGDLLSVLNAWLLDGGTTTLEGFRKLAPDDREALVDYLEEFSPYEMLDVEGRKFILVHGGIPYDKRNIPLNRQSVHELVSERPDYSKRYFENAYLVTGHTPTVTIHSKYAGHIYRANGHIAVDCGAGYDLPLGCIRLEDFYEFYV